MFPEEKLGVTARLFLRNHLGSVYIFFVVGNRKIEPVFKKPAAACIVHCVVSYHL